MNAFVFTISGDCLFMLDGSLYVYMYICHLPTSPILGVHPGFHTFAI